MRETEERKILNVEQCESFANYSLKELNSWNAGGVCRRCCVPRSAAEAAFAVKAYRSGEPLYVLGGGSNILVQDGFVDATVLHTARLDAMKTGRNASGGVDIEVEPGLPVKKLLGFAIRNDLTGLEFLTGIPGTLGGALWGNAGAAGEGFSNAVSSVETLDKDGLPRLWNAEELTWAYRKCPWEESGSIMITKAVLSLKRADKSLIYERIRFFAGLKKGQPLGKKTAGCVFKNPQGASAGKLLDESGCKGMREGGAEVSSSHANFIENCGGAAATDIFTLAERCRDRVFQLYGVRLEYEIRFFGSFPQN